jgi:hypothetical protein
MAVVAGLLVQNALKFELRGTLTFFLFYILADFYSSLDKSQTSLDTMRKFYLVNCNLYSWHFPPAGFSTFSHNKRSVPIPSAMIGIVAFGKRSTRRRQVGISFKF